jgi:hypothetical protein
MRSTITSLCWIWLLTGLMACTAGPGGAVRTWVDAKTAVAVTAQARPLVLSREDFPAGVNVRDYAELGAVEVNRSGTRKRYLAVVMWSTVARTPAELEQLQDAFSSITLWADDRPIALQRSATTHEAILVSTPILKLPSPAASEAYYEVTATQLATLAATKRLSLRPGTVVEGESAYTLWRGDLSELSRFLANLVSN